MRKMLIFATLTTWVFVFLTSIESLSAESGYTVTIMAYFDPENSDVAEPIEITGVQYGANLVFDIDDLAALAPGYEFRFFIVNGVVSQQKRQNNRFFVRGNMTIEAVFSKANTPQHAIVFMDTNGKTIDVSYVEDGGTVIEPAVDYSTFSKPNHVVQSAQTRWHQSLVNITDSGIRILQYQLDMASEFSVTVDNATLLTASNGTEDSDKYMFNTVVTIQAEAPAEGWQFSHFEINDDTVSYDNVYKVTVLEDTRVTAVYVSAETSVTPTANM